MIVFFCLQEMQLCPDCFRHSNELKPGWFTLPCGNPHEAVWAKKGHQPYWPAKVIRYDESKNVYDVRYFGGKHERAEIHKRNIKSISMSLAGLGIRKTPTWMRAYEGLQKFQELAAAFRQEPSHSRAPIVANASSVSNHEQPGDGSSVPNLHEVEGNVLGADNPTG